MVERKENLENGVKRVGKKNLEGMVALTPLMVLGSTLAVGSIAGYGVYHQTHDIGCTLFASAVAMGITFTAGVCGQCY